MEVVSWARLTAELGVRYTPVVAWSEKPALEAAARKAVRRQAMNDAQYADEEADEHQDDAARPGPPRPAVLWRRDGVNVAALLDVCNPSSLDEQARARRGSQPAPLRGSPRRAHALTASPRRAHALTRPCRTRRRSLTLR